ncbi:8077_t:CDS:2 [Paraglomus brasilianum]|uniref:8077_t:CDS:1 n=1 Tax=Paraglomus brasilianum TaxID=144538 RepID=A0A9N8ZJ11_9GLOM|nr:8077_t:CDS:2 [Paraglomus brasilianum]
MSREKQSINLSDTTQAVANPPPHKRRRHKSREIDYTGHLPIMTVKQRNRQTITRPKKICKKCQQREKELETVESKLEKVEKLVDELKMSIDDVHEEVKEEGSSNNNAMFAGWTTENLTSFASQISLTLATRANKQQLRRYSLKCNDQEEKLTDIEIARLLLRLKQI